MYVCLFCREGTLKIGDRILAINNVNISQSTLTEAMAIIKHADREIRLLVEYDVSVMGKCDQGKSGKCFMQHWPFVRGWTLTQGFGHFLFVQLEQAVDQTIELLVIWHAMMLLSK